MKCKKCNNNDAVFFITRESATVPRIGFCDECSEEIGIFAALRRVETVLHGYGVEHSSEFGFSHDSSPVDFADKCNRCGTTLKDFESKFMLGCEDCGIVFGSIISNYLTLLGCPENKLSFFSGKSPARFSKKGRIHKLQSEIEQFISKEDYAEAAKARDKLNELITSGEITVKKRKSPSNKNKYQELDSQGVASLMSELKPDIAADEIWVRSFIEARRNFSISDFPHKCGVSQLGLAEKFVLGLLPGSRFKEASFIRLRDLSKIERLCIGESLFERRLMDNAAVVVGRNGSATATINDHDHLTLGAGCFGGPDGLADHLETMLARIDSSNEVSFSPRFGFLSSQPRHIGSGTAAGTILHLPFSFLTGSNPATQETASKLSIRMEPLRGTHFEQHGFFRISSTAGFGRTSRDIATEVFGFSEKLVKEEETIRSKLKQSDISRVRNILPRVLHHSSKSYKLSYTDVLRFTSFVTMGVSLEMLDMPGFNISDVVPGLSSARIMNSDNTVMSMNECEARRADLFAELIERWSLPRSYNHEPRFHVIASCHF